MKPTVDAVRAHLRAGDLRRAERDARALLAATTPQRPEHLYLLGVARLERGFAAEALDLFERAVALAPTQPDLLEALALARLRTGDADGAEREALLAGRMMPGRARPANLQGLARLERGDIEGAIECFSRAAAIEQPNLEAAVNLALALNRGGDWKAAEDWARLALAIDAKHAPAWINLGMSLKAQRRLDEAKDAFRRAGPDPRARFDLGYTLLLQGAIADGLPLLESRKGPLGIGRGLTKKEWDGTPRPGKTLLVIHEQGMGDTILTCRFWPALTERFARVVACVQPPLERLLRESFPGIEIVASTDGVAYDTWCATMSLPFLLGVDSVDAIPRMPWIPVAGAARPDADAARPLRVGLNWAGNPKFAFDRVRSTHLAELALLLQAPGIEWVSLHRGHLEHEAEAAGLPQPLREATDFLDTARVIAGLDLVVSTETAVPNLSAAMGVPTCVLASLDWDWRWAHWYANVRMCAQDEPGVWLGAVVRVLEALRDEMAKREAGAAA